MSAPSLKKFQERGRDFLAARTRALLADDMRLGKTWQTVTAWDVLEAGRCRVICPGSAVGVWRATIKELSPQREIVTELSALHDGACVEIFSYDTARDHLPKFERRARVDVLVADESHYAKSPTAKRAKLIFGRGGLGWYADRVWCLSGTPAPNHAGELWTLARAFGATKLGYTDWIKRYCNCNQYGEPKSTKKRNIPELRKILAPFTLRRLKKDVAPELPRMTVEPWFLEPSTKLLAAARPLHDQKITAEALKQEERLRNALSKLPQEKQLAYLEQHANDYASLRRYTSLLKVDAVFQQVCFELDEGLVDKIVLFAYHREPIRTLHMLLKDYGAVAVWGGQTAKQIEHRVARFSTGKKCRVFIGQIIAAGTAIDLSAAHQGILVERDWVPGNNAQAMERMGGFKQTMPVTIRDAVLPGSIDSVVRGVVAQKEQELAAIFD